jgi:2-oxoglutarate ferredoxin oxidoreductase subunit beta
MGSVDHPFNPIALALGAEGSFIARSMDRDPVHLKEMLRRSNAHIGTSLLEIYQNCNVFNDGTFEIFTEKSSKKEETIFLENNKPLVFGQNSDKGIMLDGFKPTIVSLEDGQHSVNDLWVHDESDLTKAGILSRFFERPVDGTGHLPRPFGVFYENNRACYETGLNAQIEFAKQKKGEGNLDALLKGGETWEIK